MSRRTTPLLEFGPFRLDAEERLLFHNGNPVALPPKTFDLLLVLVENRGHLLEKEELMTRLWPDSFVEEANLSRHVFTLRRALSDGESGVSYIETVPKRGYRFVTAVHEISVEPATIGRDSPMAAARESVLRWRKLSGRSLLLVAALALAVTLMLILIRAPRRTSRVHNSSTASGIESLAVLPLRNLSDDPEQE